MKPPWLLCRAGTDEASSYITVWCLRDNLSRKIDPVDLHSVLALCVQLAGGINQASLAHLGT
jgi:hypothetical protein